MASDAEFVTRVQAKELFNTCHNKVVLGRHFVALFLEQVFMETLVNSNLYRFISFIATIYRCLSQILKQLPTHKNSVVNLHSNLISINTGVYSLLYQRTFAGSKRRIMALVF